MPFAQLMAVLPLRDVACSLRVPSNPNGLKYNKDENETVIAHRSDCGLFLFRQKKGVRQWMSNSKLIELSYYDPSAQVRLSAYADTLVLDHDQNGSIISAIRFGGYPEMVRAMADAIYGGATIEAAQNDTTRMLQSSLKSYQRQITHDGIYAVATLMAADTVQEDDRSGKHEKDEDTNLVDTEQMELQPRRCYIFCPARDQKRLFEELDHKTAAPLIPEFQDYVLSSLRQRGDLRQLEVISLKERIDAWVLDLKPQDQNVVEVLERGLQSGDIQIPGAVPNMPDGFENVENVTGYMREEYKLTEADRNASFIFLLDGFNEIPTTTMQIRCLRDILDISDKKYPEAAIILSNRDPLDTYMDLLEYENGFDADQIDRLKFYFHNCYIKELSQEQIDDYFEPNQRCLVPAARNILDTPFYLVLYRQAMQPSGKDAGRWITDAFQDHLNNGTPEKTTLMLQMLLREIDNLRSDITSAERELRCFILTKVLPYLGYQMALSSHLDPALTPIKSPNFFRRDTYARTYACLSAYLPTIDIWNEYKNQNPETLEKPWNTLRKLYQDSNPDISDLTAAIPYTVFPSGLLCHHGRNISFCHDNYRDFFAAFHIANVVYGLYSGIDLAALSPDAQEVFLLQLETLDNSILFDAISILRQYFGLSIYDISAQDTTDLSDTCAQIALPAILIRLLDAVIRRGELSKNEHSQLCQLRSTLCERFVLSFKALDESDPLQTKYCLFFSLALSMLARDYRTGVAGTRDLIKCAGYAQQCINGEKKLNIPKADGYLQVALCLNARMEDMLNVTDTKMNGTLPFSSQLADAVREAVRDYHEGSMYKRDEAVRTFRRNLFPRWKPGLGNVLACCDIFQIILEAAYEKYVSAANQNNQNYQEIARLGYVSKAYLVLAAIGTSGGALNLLAQMLINQANQYEADQRISFFRRHPDIDTFVQQHAAPYGWPLNDNYALAYRVLQSVCGIQRGSQPYSHMKKAELVLKGYVSESSSTQLTSLNIAINGGLAMGHYWKGRLLLEQAKQDHDRCNDYKDAAIASFCATNVTERFDHLPENADEDAAPQLSPPQWLSAIELLRYPDRAVFRVDRRMVFQTIYQKLTQQVEEVQSDNIQIHNERYRLTKKDVRSNLERCLDMVKAQFPDKEPLIQKMIRSIR